MDEDSGTKLRRSLCSAVDGAGGAEEGRGERRQATSKAVVVEQQDAEVASVDNAVGDGAGEGIVLQRDHLEVGLVGRC